MRSKSRYLVFLLVGSIPLLYQACSPAHSYLESGESQSLQWSSPLTDSAMKVIEQHCASCHGNGASQGGVSQINDLAALVRNGLVIPGDADGSRIVTSVEDGSMPIGYSLQAVEAKTLRDWVESLATAAPITPVVTPACSITIDKTTISVGQSVQITISVTGSADLVTLEGQSVALTGGSISLTPSSSTQFNGSVTNSAGTSTCQSPLLMVNPVVVTPNAPTCTLTSNVAAPVPGDNVTLTLNITGAATSAKIGNQTVNVANPSLVVTVLANSNYVGSVTGVGGTNTCTRQVNTKATASLTEDEFYRAKIGPQGQSVDDLVTSRCMNCHTDVNPPAAYIGAKDWFIIKPNDPAGNLARMRRIVSPVNPAKILDMTTGAANGSGSLHSFAKGHKPKNPPYTAADLVFIKLFVDSY